MKRLIFIVCCIGSLVANQIPDDYPYTCGEEEECASNCDPGLAVCTVAGTLPYPTYCSNVVVEGKSVRCIVKKVADMSIVADSGTSKCSGFTPGGDGGPGGCDPGSGAWWVGCDPFAY